MTTAIGGRNRCERNQKAKVLAAGRETRAMLVRPRSASDHDGEDRHERGDDRACSRAPSSRCIWFSAVGSGCRRLVGKPDGRRPRG